MTDLVPLFPRQPVPPLNVNLAGGGLFDLRSERPKHFTLLLFYRGLHCPICKGHLRELESKLDEFDKRGVAVVVVSSDTKERAAQTREAWGLRCCESATVSTSPPRAAGDCSSRQGAE